MVKKEVIPERNCLRERLIPKRNIELEKEIKLEIGENR